MDPNTWGHVRWERALSKVGVAPLFGVALGVAQAGERSPQAWLLASDTRGLYDWLSHNRAPGPEDWAAAGRFAVRFAGDGLTDPETFDYVDTNPRSILAGHRAIELARRTGKPLVVTSDGDYPGPDDWRAFLALTDNRRMTPQHLLTDDELRASLPWLSDAQWRAAVRNTHEVAERLKGWTLPRAPIIKFEGDLEAQLEEGKRYRLEAGHIASWTDEYDSRLRRELELIREKQYESYFLVVGDLVRWAKERMLVGPGRGSSAGSLACFLLQITEVDPLPHHLLFERFIDVTRNDLPDIDIDFSDRARDEVFTYLADKYGRDNVARLGNVSTLKPRSVIAECGKRLGIPKPATFSIFNVLIEYTSGDSRYGHSLEDTLLKTDPGRRFTEQYPEAGVIHAAEGHAWHTSVHAAGVLVSTEPVTNYCVVYDGVAQLDKPDAEHLGLLKIDALGLRTLGVIEDAGCVTSRQLYDLKLDDPAVFAIFNERKFAGVFQFEGAAQRRVSMQIPIKSFQQIDHVTALARPGPLGGGAAHSYVRRNDGAEPIVFRHPSMEHYLGDTLGVVLYQEQVMRISREIGDFSWAVVAEIRKAMSGRKGKEYFDRRGAEFLVGAARLGLDATAASIIWNEICTFGAWGMNKSHTVSYGIIAYWTAWMKAYHPIEYAAALLRNAKDDIQVIETLRELTAEGVRYVPFDPERSAIDWSVQDGTLYGGYQILHGIGVAKATGLVARRDAGTLTKKDRELIAAAKPKFAELREAHAMWGEWYENPDKFGVGSPIREVTELRDRERAVVLLKIVRRVRRDENEAVRVGRRNGARFEGQPLFLDLYGVDDSVTKPITLRIRPKDWFRLGVPIVDKLRDEDDWVLVRGMWLEQFSMITVERIWVITQPELKFA